MKTHVGGFTSAPGQYADAIGKKLYENTYPVADYEKVSLQNMPDMADDIKL